VDKLTETCQRPLQTFCLDAIGKLIRTEGFPVEDSSIALKPNDQSKQSVETFAPVLVDSFP
jgi:hypothetical protein